MTWTYTPDFTQSRDKVRFLIGDTNTNDQLVSDEEIAFALAQNANIYRAGAILCRGIGLKLSRQLTLDPAPGGVSLDSQAQAEKYLKLADDLEDQAVSVSSAASVFAGGISVADKAAREADSDRVSLAFTSTLHQTDRTPNDTTSRDA